MYEPHHLILAAFGRSNANRGDDRTNGSPNTVFEQYDGQVDS
jgi:hypothetical protein